MVITHKSCLSCTTFFFSKLSMWCSFLLVSQNWELYMVLAWLNTFINTFQYLDVSTLLLKNPFLTNRWKPEQNSTGRRTLLSMRTIPYFQNVTFLRFSALVGRYFYNMLLKVWNCVVFFFNDNDSIFQCLNNIRLYNNLYNCCSAFSIRMRMSTWNSKHGSFLF